VPKASAALPIVRCQPSPSVSPASAKSRPVMLDLDAE
jgi:hypothetical protein